MSSAGRVRDEGFTLIEMVIAIIVMTVAVVALVSGLTVMLQLSSTHRGSAALETGAHSFSQAVVAAAQFQTTLSVAADSSQSSLSVADASLLAVGEYVSVDRETMTVTSVGAGGVGVTRAQGATQAAGHAVGARLVRLLRCPSATELTPPTGTYQVSAGLGAPSVTGVEYLTSAGTFSSSQSSCLAAFNALCPSGQVTADCSVGLFRVAIQDGTSDPRFASLTTQSSLLVRQAGS